MKSILLILLSLLTLVTSGQEWRTLNDLEINNPEVWSLDVLNDSLFIGGPFSVVNDQLTIGSFIWDSSSVHIHTPGIMESGSGGYAKGHLFYGDTLILHGQFDFVNDIPESRSIVQKKTSDWETIGGSCLGGTDGVERAIVWEGELYASHGYIGIGDLTDTYSFAKWNGVEWIELESVLGFDVAPIELCIFDGQIWGGGDLQVTTAGEDVHNVVYFDGTHWQDPNGGMSGKVQALYPDEEEGVLYVAGNGSLAQLGDVSCPNSICLWDGENWHPVGEFNDINYDITAIAKYRGQIYVGGYFQLNGVTTKLAYFDGYHWQPVPGAGEINQWVYDLQVYKDELYVGGDFSDIAGLGVGGVARYYLHPDSVVWGEPDTSISVVEQPLPNSSELLISPNPSQGELTVQFGFTTDRELQILDLHGKTLYQSSPGDRESELIDLRDLPAGTYVCVLLSNGVEPTISKSFVIQR